MPTSKEEWVNPSIMRFPSYTCDGRLCHVRLDRSASGTADCILMMNSTWFDLDNPIGKLQNIDWFWSFSLEETGDLIIDIGCLTGYCRPKELTAKGLSFWVAIFIPESGSLKKFALLILKTYAITWRYCEFVHAHPPAYLIFYDPKLTLGILWLRLRVKP